MLDLRLNHPFSGPGHLGACLRLQLHGVLFLSLFSALIFGSLKYSVLERKDPMKWAMRLIPFYLALTSAILALFIVVEAPTAPSLGEFSAGNAVGIILGVFFGVLAIGYIFFVPYFHRRLVVGNVRLQWYHVPLGPMLRRNDACLYWPADPNGEVVIDYYESTHESASPAIVHTSERKEEVASSPSIQSANSSPVLEADLESSHEMNSKLKKIMEPNERFSAPTQHLPLCHPSRLWSWTKFIVLQGVYRDCISYSSEKLASTHKKAIRYDNKIEHLWTWAQVASAMMMSIAHGSNDVANAVGPWAAVYARYNVGVVDTESETPVWMLVVAEFLLGLGFWVFGYHIIRSLGNKITQLSPTRGFSMELGAAITVLLASRLGLPVSTTQCLTGACVGVALMNYDLGAVNWKQLGFIFSGGVITLPVAGLISGILMAMSLNAPQF